MMNKMWEMNKTDGGHWPVSELMFWQSYSWSISMMLYNGMQVTAVWQVQTKGTITPVSLTQVASLSRLLGHSVLGERGEGQGWIS